MTTTKEQLKTYFKEISEHIIRNRDAKTDPEFINAGIKVTERMIENMDESDVLKCMIESLICVNAQLVNEGIEILNEKKVDKVH